MFSLAVATVLAASLAAPSMAALNKPVLFTDGLSPHVDWSFWANLAPTQSTWTQWAWGWLPEACDAAARANNVSPYDMEVFNVQYTDCSTAWVFCRHHNASLSQIDLIDLFGRLPVHERQWVRHVIGVPGGGSAYATAGEVVFQGPVGAPSVFQHEVGHLVDAYRNGVGSSSSTSFLNAIAQDTCVPDDYSNSSEAEDYTQVGVLSLFEIVTPGGLDVASGNWRCLEKQKNALDALQRADMIPGGTCTRRWANSENVAMSARVKKAIDGPPEEPAGLPKVPVDNAPIHPTQFKNVFVDHAARAKSKARILGWQKAAGKPVPAGADA